MSSSKMTDAERLKLAEKLDKELDEFIDGLEKKRYTEGWPEDRWQEEMEKHPFFMKKPPEPGDDVNPLLAGIQQLKYDPDENTTEELAKNYKEDGNFYIKHKKYRMAIISYTEGLKIKCENTEINSTLYNNRSAAHFFLQNYRSSLLDAQQALKLNPDYEKARWRAAQCAYNLSDFKLATDYCNLLLESKPQNEAAIDLLKKIKMKKQKNERDDRKNQAFRKRRIEQLNRLISELKKRNIKFDDDMRSEITEDILKPKLLPLQDHPVKLNENGNLLWPSVFSYPEFEISDFNQQLNETMKMHDVIDELFFEGLQYDKENKYVPENVNVYYENRRTGTIHKVDGNKTIRDIVSEKNFYISGGALLFYVVPKDSDIEKNFVNEARRPKGND